MLSKRPGPAGASERLVAASSPAGTAPTPASAPEAALEPCAAEPFVRVCRVVVKADRMVCDVKLSPACPRLSSPAFVNALLQTHPHLPAHACKNERGTTFGAVMNRTPLIHILEHVTIDCMVQNESAKTTSSDTLFVGNSRWLDPVQGLGRVELGFRDDIAALRALKTAVEQVNRALASC